MTIYADPGSSFIPYVSNAPTGVAGSIGLRIFDPVADVDVVARFTAGIVERPDGSGIYYAPAQTAPATEQTYQLIWDSPASPPDAVEDLIVTFSAPQNPVTTYYAQFSDLVAYLQDSAVTTPSSDAGERLLRRCEIEVDSLLVGFGAPYDDSGLKYHPSTDLVAYQAAALMRAVCAQAEYALTQGDAFFTQAQYDSWQGPDFAAKGKLPYFGPRVALELAVTGIARTPGIASISTSYLGSPAARLGGLDNIRAN